MDFHSLNAQHEASPYEGIITAWRPCAVSVYLFTRTPSRLHLHQQTLASACSLFVMSGTNTRERNVGIVLSMVSASIMKYSAECTYTEIVSSADSFEYLAADLKPQKRFLHTVQCRRSGVTQTITIMNFLSLEGTAINCTLLYLLHGSQNICIKLNPPTQQLFTESETEVSSFV